MKSDILGVIGGLGPLATTFFMEEIARMTQTDREQDHVDMIVYNFPSIPDRTGYILGSNLRSPLPGLMWAGRALAREGVSAIAIPCITAHYFYDELQESVTVPILHTLRETARELKEVGVSRAGLMATEGTIHAGLFARELMNAGITPVLPLPQRQQDLSQLIYGHIKKGLPGDMNLFRQTEEDLRSRGAEVVVLGCTELSTLRRQENLGPGFLDALQVLARASVQTCGKQPRPEYKNLITG